MGSFQITCLDLQCGGGLNFSPMSDDGEESTCISDDEEGSCHTQFYSTAAGSIDGRDFDFEIDEAFDTRRVSSVVGSECSIDIENELHRFNIFLETMEKGCRICHLSFQVDGSDVESEIAIELGCSCKNDLAAAHQHCAETWFKIRGNRICEICNSIARNVVVPNEIVTTQHSTARNVVILNEIASTRQIPEVSTLSTSANSVPVQSTSETLTFLIGHRLVNILLPCVVSVFFLSWLFHFHMPF